MTCRRRWWCRYFCLRL
ncbi:unnamed protein product [Spirodela intermedia]|uniref:Uncharacterized protein n=2 Tax=Spirodela intermedia TaxID=51605 RepID=A0A7I8LMA7_SPIIN|nr:unnamed protein product [Spirodela intermedia]CAA6673152.1 unnamed protein product [Spirodela intermedia]CAA7410374.1 unnamed protein product [Spirodela intermedia]